MIFKRIIFIGALLFAIQSAALAQMPSEKSRPLYVGAIVKWVGGLGAHIEVPLGNHVTFRAETGWLVFLIDMNAGLGFSLHPRLEVYGAFHVTNIYFLGRATVVGPEVGVDWRIFDFLHLEGGVTYLTNDTDQATLPNVGLSFNFPIRF